MKNKNSNRTTDETKENCDCSPDCTCESDCDCTPENKCNEDCTCNCGETCNCNETCDCNETDNRKSDCDCGETCDCEGNSEHSENNDSKTCDGGETCACSDDCDYGVDECNNLEHKEYLNDLLRLQAEFDNYRKRMQNSLSDARQDGFIEAIEKFLPAIDSFKMATDMITDKNTLTGIKFIEKGILDTLSKMGVNEIDCSGKFDPNFHQAIDTDTTSDAPPDSITKVVYKGFTYKGKVIRYAQVVVRK